MFESIGNRRRWAALTIAILVLAVVLASVGIWFVYVHVSSVVGVVLELVACVGIPVLLATFTARPVSEPAPSRVE